MSFNLTILDISGGAASATRKTPEQHHVTTNSDWYDDGFGYFHLAQHLMIMIVELGCRALGPVLRESIMLNRLNM